MADAHTPPEAMASRGRHIRPVAIGVIVWRDHLLAHRGYDHLSGEAFCRPPGGGIDFGERARDAVVREFREELERPIEVDRLLAVSENLFNFDGTPEHQIVFEFIARFGADHQPPDLLPLTGHEDDGTPYEAHWLPVDAVFDGTHVVYPDGLPERLAAWLRP